MRYLARLTCFSLLSCLLCAQTIDLSQTGAGAISLAGKWRFHPGDDMRWKNPAFDDSNWQLVDVPRSLMEQGYPKFSGYGWYRLTLTCDQHCQMSFGPEMRLAVDAVAHVSAYFANGEPIGSFGSFPPHPRPYYWRPVSFPISARRWRSDRLVLAVRFWTDPRFVGIGDAGFAKWDGAELNAPTIGSSQTIVDVIDARERKLERGRLPSELAKFAGLLLGLYLLGTYLTEDRRPEYLWLGLNFVGDALFLSLTWIAHDTIWLTLPQWVIFQVLLNPLLYASSIFGIWAIFDVPVRPILLGLLSCRLLYDFAGCFVLEMRGPAFDFRWQLAGAILGELLVCTILVFLLHKALTRHGELRWVSLCFVPFFLVFFLRMNYSYVPAISRYVDRAMLELLFSTTNLFAVVGVGFILLRRSGRAKAESDRLHVQMDAARHIQQLMLPAQSLGIPNVQVQTAYLPSQEVGGDFYQFASAPDGSLLLLIGDVSGKGLQAALTMSLIIGFWQKLICSTLSPALLLGELNELLHQRLDEGFVTALCARIEPNGLVIIANAGHLAPYLNGEELCLCNGLPLAIGARTEYSESQVALDASDALLFVTDGVVEAGTKTRTLFGFERLERAIAEHLTPEAIARRAQQFGQQDDITVIALHYLGAKPTVPA